MATVFFRKACALITAASRFCKRRGGNFGRPSELLFRDFNDLAVKRADPRNITRIEWEPMMKTIHTAAVLAVIALGAGAATLAMTDRAESFSYRLTPPSDAVQRNTASPSLDNLAVMELVTAYGEEQAYDEPYCDVRVTVTETLVNDFQESRVTAPEEREGMFVELWASDRLGTWTMLATRADGISCVIETGRDWAGETSLDTLAAG